MSSKPVQERWVQLPLWLPGFVPHEWSTWGGANPIPDSRFRHYCLLVDLEMHRFLLWRIRQEWRLRKVGEKAVGDFQLHFLESHSQSDSEPPRFRGNGWKTTHHAREDCARLGYHPHSRYDHIAPFISSVCPGSDDPEWQREAQRLQEQGRL